MTAISDDLIVDSVESVYRACEAWQRRPPTGTGEDTYRNFVEYLRRTVPFYQSRRDISGGDLPLVDRALYRSSGQSFRSITQSSGDYAVTSSGTTGEPLTITLDEGSWYAVNYHFFGQIRQITGLPERTFQRGELAVIFVSNKPSRSNVIRPMPSLNHGLYLRLQLAPSAETTLALYEKLRAPILYGKPTYLLDLRSALISQGAMSAPWSPQLLLVSGEFLHVDDRKRLVDYFGAPIVDALASTEGGLIAATRPDGDTYSVFQENVLLEILTSDGAVGPSGKGEIVMTNLVNRSTVFARYRTGDYAELDTDTRDGTQRIIRLLGREPESIQCRSRELRTDRVTEKLGFLRGVGDFQVVAGRPDHTLFRWTPDALCEDVDAVQADLRDAIAELLPDEDIVIERCARITPLGGKKRRFIRDDANQDTKTT